jgi:hypothetical protein
MATLWEFDSPRPHSINLSVFRAFSVIGPACEERLGAVRGLKCNADRLACK